MLNKIIQTKRHFIVLISVLLVTLFLCLSLISIGGVAYAESSSLRETRILDFIDRNVSGMNQEYGTSLARGTTKTLNDFAGNTYTLVECLPTGYMIMCDDSATMVEYSGDSPSPYSGYDSNLFYAGPTFYYVYSNGEYILTITSEVLSISSASNGARTTNIDNQLSAICNEMHDDLTADSNTSALNYIKTGVMPRKEIIGLYGESWTCVNNMAFFSSKRTHQQIGYKSGGYCGYIAAGLLLGYYDTFIRECVDDSYMEGAGVNRHFTGPGLVDELFSDFSSGSTSTTSTVIRHTLNNYFDHYGYDLGSYDMITPFFSGTTLKNLVDKNTPSILFGNLGAATDPIVGTGKDGDKHAVVVYGYKKGGTGGALYSLLVHFGWSNYSQSTVNYLSYSVFGSMYRITT